jgi:two-component system sensor histidine kinase AlgZ
MKFLTELSAFRDRGPADCAARLADLQARIAPHFLFNTLNTAIALIRQDPARAEGVLEDLADLFRQALADPSQVVCLSDEVALARRYLRIEQARFGPRLRVQWRLDPRTDGVRVLPLLLQPLVENAVQHGVQPSAQGAQVQVCTQRRGDSAVITIRNTVPQGPGPAGSGLALANVRERLQLLYDARCRFRAGLSAGVFEVQMEVPA